MTRVTEKACEFNRDFVAQLMGEESGNGEHLQIARRALHDVLENELTSRQREVLLLYYYEGKKMPEIASQLHLNKSTVCRTIRRGKARIRQSMRFYFDYTSFRLRD